jgi:hypothetical protein
MVAAQSILQRTLEMAEALPPEERRLLIELLERRLVDERREEIASNATSTLRAVRSGRATLGTADDLRRLLESTE